MNILILVLLLVFTPSVAWAQAGFLQAVPGTGRPTCASITAPVTNQTWCADASAGPASYLWKVWDGSSYVTVGGGGGPSGITTINTVSDANVTLNGLLVGTTETLTMGWTGLLPLSRGGLGIGVGVSGGVPYFSSTNTVASSGVLNALIVGGGSGASPFDYAGASCPGGQVVSAVSPTGALTCVTPAGTGTVTGTGVNTQIAVWDAASNITGFTDSTWDDTAKILNIGPGATLTGAGQAYVIGGGGSGNNVTNASAVYIHGAGNDLTGSFDSGAWGESHTITGSFDSYAYGEGCSITGGTSNAVCVNTTAGSPSSITGTGSGSFGFSNTISDVDSFAIGQQIALSNSGAVGVGNSITVSGVGSMGFGTTLTVTHDNALLYGSGGSSQANNSVSIGVSATPEVTITAGTVTLPSLATGGAAQCVQANSTGVVSLTGVACGGAGSSPGAPLTSVQYNNGGAFAGDAAFVFDNATKVVTVGDLLITNQATGGAAECLQVGTTGGVTKTGAPCGGAGSSPGAPVTSVQFNSAGSFAGDANLTWDNALKLMLIGGQTPGTLAPLRLFTREPTAPNVTPGNFFPATQVVGIDMTTAASNNTTGLAISVLQDGVLATRIKTGITLNSYHQADNGGDVSGLTTVETGGGNALTAWKCSTRCAPGGHGALPANGFAAEIGYEDSAAALYVNLEPFASTNPGQGIHVEMNGVNSKGILVTPAFGGSFNTRPAFEVAQATYNSATNTLQKFQVLLNGHTAIGGTADTTAGIMLSVLDTVSASGSNIKLTGSGATPNKYLRSVAGHFGILNSAYTTTLLDLDDAGLLALSGKVTRYNSFPPTSGQLLIGNAGTGTWDASTLTAGANITVTNGPGTIQIAATGIGPGAPSTAVQFNNVGVFAGDALFTWDNAAKRLTVGSGDQFTVTGAGAKTPDRWMTLEGTAGSPQTSPTSVGTLFQTQAITSTVGCNNRIDPNCGSALAVLVKKTATSSMQATAIYGAVQNSSTAAGGLSGGDSATFYADALLNNPNAGAVAYFGDAQRNVNTGFVTAAFEAHMTNNTGSHCTYSSGGTNCAAVQGYYDDNGTLSKGGIAYVVRSIGAGAGSTGVWQVGLGCTNPGAGDFCIYDAGLSTASYRDQGSHTRGIDLAAATYTDAALVLSSTTVADGKIRWGSGMFLEGNTPSFDPGVDNTGVIGTVAHRWNTIRGVSIAATTFFASGTPGFSGSKVAGACTFTISGGIITNVTGC